MREVKRQREPSGPQWNKQHFWAPGTTQTISFCLVQKKGSVKEKNKTIKSICRGNVNTACWVAVHLVGKMHLSLGGIAGSVSFRSCLGAGGSPWTQGCTGAGPLPGLCGWWSSLCSWLSAIITSPHLSVHLSFCQLPRAVLKTVHFYGRLGGKAERRRFRVSRYMD